MDAPPTGPEVITCPRCGHAFEPTALLRAKIEEQIRSQLETAYAARLSGALEQAGKQAVERLQAQTEQLKRTEEELTRARARVGEAAKKEADLLRRERELSDRQEQAALDMERKLADATAQIRIQADKQARERAELATAEAVRLKDEELAAAQKRLGEATLKEAEILRREREMQDRERQIPVELERRLNEEASKVRENLTREVQETQRLHDEDHRQQILGLQRTIDDLQRKAAQGSQQIQGEAQEVVLKDLLARAFPRDDVEDVAKGTPGADLQQRIRDDTGADCGAILWESKRTKAWSDEWLPKLRDDMRTAGAACAAIVSRTLPPDIAHFAQRDGIWVCSWDVVVPMAAVLRAGLIEVAVARQTAEGRDEKVQLLYNYLTSPEFNNRVGGVVEAFTDMRKDLEDEMKKMRALWAKRSKQLDRALVNMAAFYGSLRGIAGGRIGEIQALEFSGPELLAAPEPDSDVSK